MVAKSTVFPELRVTDPQTKQATVFQLSDQDLFQIGRARANEIAVSGDLRISREHAVMSLENGSARIACLPEARNPIVVDGVPSREVIVAPGGRFRIGKTIFDFKAPQELSADSLSDIAPSVDLLEDNRDNPVQRDADTWRQRKSLEENSASVADVHQIGLSADELAAAPFCDPIRQLDLISRLPAMIASGQTDNELAHLLAGLLLDAIPEAVAVSAAQYDADVVTALREGISHRHCDLARPRTMQTRTRDDSDGRFRPSRQLVGSAMRSGECTIQLRLSSGLSLENTAGRLGWAFCVPVPGSEQEGWCLYVAGSGGRNGESMPAHDDLLGHVRLAHMLAQFIGSVRHVRQLQDRKTRLSSYFSPDVVEDLTDCGDDTITPTSGELSVLFCDVHGFSRKSERHEEDLDQLVECVKEALDAMTRGILSRKGTIADFQGDSALGFWGWPVSQADGAASACLAALEVEREFRSTDRPNDLLDDFSIGLGIASGKAIASQIGTRHQQKIGVFGPAVNQGSRLEGMTRQFGVSICIDGKTARCVQKHLAPEQARVRKLACVRPVGMDAAIDVYQLLPPSGEHSAVSEKQIRKFEEALALVIRGDWKSAVNALRRLPDEGPKEFLLEHMSELGNTPPPGWTGVFPLRRK